MPEIDPAGMTDEEIETYARQAVLESGDPEGEWEPLATALKNAAAFDAAMKDPYWRDLKSKESADMAEIDWSPPEREEE